MNRMRVAVAVGSLLAAALLVMAVGAWLAYGVDRMAASKATAGVYANESNVIARHGQRLRPLAIVLPGEPVAVLWDTYGKDYWACYVRTASGVRGWMDCTLLDAPTNQA